MKSAGPKIKRTKAVKILSLKFVLKWGKKKRTRFLIKIAKRTVSSISIKIKRM